MLNWPGAKGRKCGSASGASVSVKVSPVSLVMWRSSNGSGRIGSELWGAIGGVSVSVAIEIQELHAHGLEPRDDQHREALQQLVAEEGGLGGREQPGPAELLAFLGGLDGDRPLVGREDLHRHMPLADQEEVVCGL